MVCICGSPRLAIAFAALRTSAGWARWLELYVNVVHQVLVRCVSVDAMHHSLDCVQLLDWRAVLCYLYLGRLWLGGGPSWLDQRWWVVWSILDASIDSYSNERTNDAIFCIIQSIEVENSMRVPCLYYHGYLFEASNLQRPWPVSPCEPHPRHSWIRILK